MSGRVSGGVLKNMVSGARQKDQTPTRHLLKNINDCNALGCLVVVSGIYCLLPKVLLSVWGGFFRNPQTRHSGRRHG